MILSTQYTKTVLFEDIQCYFLQDEQ